MKATDVVEITIKEFFSATYLTTEMYNDQQIKKMKKIVEEKASKKKDLIEFFEKNGIIFYSHTSSEKIDKKKCSITTLNILKDYTLSSEGDAWRYGFYNKQSGKIILLFGGNYVAKGKTDSYKLFKLAKTITQRIFFKKEKTELIAFAQKD